jgi:hypothetical protein
MGTKLISCWVEPSLVLSRATVKKMSNDCQYSFMFRRLIITSGKAWGWGEVSEGKFSVMSIRAAFVGNLGGREGAGRDELKVLFINSQLSGLVIDRLFLHA